MESFMDRHRLKNRNFVRVVEGDGEIEGGEGVEQ